MSEATVSRGAQHATESSFGYAAIHGRIGRKEEGMCGLRGIGGRIEWMGDGSRQVDESRRVLGMRDG